MTERANGVDEMRSAAAVEASRDRLTTAMAQQGLEFFRQSDFRGTGRQGVDAVKVFGSLLGGMLRTKVAGETLSPVRPSTLQARDVVGQPPIVAERNLSARGVTVNRVESAAAATKPTELLSAFPMRLREGDRVTLFEENGQVRSFAVESREAIATPREAASEGASRADAPRLLASPATAANVDQLRAEVDALREECAALRATQKELLARLAPERLDTVEQPVRRLAADPTAATAEGEGPAPQ
jgi:hypothetical protein